MMFNRSQTLMHLQGVGHQSTYFWEEVPSSAVSKVTVIFPTADWREMGAPMEITLTLEAGDKLNEENGELR
jgi:hypothetical protein